MQKTELSVTTDYMSDLLHRKVEKHYTKKQLNDLMAYSASLGASRHEWVADTWLLDEDLGGDGDNNGAGFDFLEEVCNAAHKHGLRLDVVLKPLEGFMPQQMNSLPETFPKPDGVPLIHENGGILHSVRPFLAENPGLRIMRRRQKNDVSVKDVAAIRLTKQDNRPLRFSKEDLSVWVSPLNGKDNFRKYDGPMTVQESSMKIARHTTESACRVLTFSGLKLPEDTRYVLVRCDKNDPQGDFCNDTRDLMTLFDEQGEEIPTTPASGPVDPEKLYRNTRIGAELGLSRYLKHPHVRALINDKEAFFSHCRGAYKFRSINHITIDQAQDAVVKLGKPKGIVGSMHPIYPQVREHWLELIKFCLDRGVDGVNLRVANHNRTIEPWYYGFNPPVREQMEYPNHCGEAARINGNAWTQFLSEARDYIHSRGKEVGIHINVAVFTQFAVNKGGPLPLNFEWQWEKWIEDIADYIEYRGIGLFKGKNNSKAKEPPMRLEHVLYILDHIGLVARKAGVPFMLQSSRMTDQQHFDGSTNRLENQMKWVQEHPDITHYNLYETVAFTRLTDDGRVEGSPNIRDAVKRQWHS